MIKVNAYESYTGGKGSDGVHQLLINMIPPHDVYHSYFLGNCTVTRKIRPAMYNILNDRDPLVIGAWIAALSDRGISENVQYVTSNRNALVLLNDLFESNPVGQHFVFLDPPYPKSTRKSQRDFYNFELTDRMHDALLLLVGEAPPNVKIMLCSYPNELYDKALGDWNRVEYNSKTRNGLALEVVYMNYKIEDGLLHDYTHIGNDYRDREALKRQRVNFMKKIDQLPTQLRLSLLKEIYTKYPPAVPQ